MQYVRVVKPDNNKKTSRELPSIVADGAGNECLWSGISKRNRLTTEGPELTVMGSSALRVCAWR
jgi:hypothetical protein